MASEIGTLKIKGELDEGNLINSLNQLKNSFDNFASKNKSSNADLTRTDKVVSSLGSGFVKLGAIAGTAMMTLGLRSSSLAPSLANIGAQLFGLGETIGADLQPAFENASNGLSNFISFMGEHDNIRKFAEVLGSVGIAALGLKAVGLGGIFAGLAPLVLEALAPILLIVGALGTIWTLLDLISGLMPTKSYRETEIDATDSAGGMFLSGRQGTFAPVMEGTGEAFFNEDNLINQLGISGAKDLMKDYNVKNTIFDSTNSEGSTT